MINRSWGHVVFITERLCRLLLWPQKNCLDERSLALLSKGSGKPTKSNFDQKKNCWTFCLHEKTRFYLNKAFVRNRILLSCGAQIMLLRMITKEFQVYAKVVAPSRVPHSQLAKRDDSLFLRAGDYQLVFWPTLLGKNCFRYFRRNTYRVCTLRSTVAIKY